MINVFVYFNLSYTKWLFNLGIAGANAILKKNSNWNSIIRVPANCHFHFMETRILMIS